MSASTVNVVHLCSSGLAGAPWALSRNLNLYGDRISSQVIFDGSLSRQFSLSCYPMVRLEKCRGTAKTLLDRADIIHIHNTLSSKHTDLLVQSSTRAKFVYHAHSPQMERPLFFRHDLHMGLDFAEKFVVCHFHPRVYQDFLPMPNCVDHPRPDRPSSVSQKVRILFSPSHKYGGRWNSKTNSDFEETTRAISRMDSIEFVEACDLSPAELFELRKTCDISIDEIITGSFHLVSLEGLACGNAVINGADEFTLWAAREGFKTSATPPFVRCRINNLIEKLTDLLRDRDQILKIKQDSYDYFEEFLRPEILVQNYVERYDRILDR